MTAHPTTPLTLGSLSEAVDHVLATVEGDIVLGLPLGIGKPNPFVNLLSQWSLRRLYNQGVGPKWPLNSTPIAYIYSSSDPKVPNGNHDALLKVMTEGVDGDNKPRAENYCIINTKDAAHVFTNADIILAREAVEYILTGEPSKKCTESAG